VNPNARVAGSDRLPGVSNYLVGNDSAAWRTSIPQFAKVRYEEVYPGIDLVYYGSGGRLEWDFVVAPGADPSVVQFTVEGGAVELDDRGDLALRAAGATLRIHKPVAYQERSGTREEIPARYTLDPGGEVGFEVGPFDRSRSLIIDPVISYGSFLGGNQDEQARAVAIDSSGNAYITGSTHSTNFPTTAGALQTGKKAGSDVFVTKLNPTGSAIVYSTYLGGSTGRDGFNLDAGYGIAVDPSGNVYVTGYTDAVDFPTTAGAFQRTFASEFGSDGFVAKLDPTGSALVYSTYLGGFSDDTGYGIALDGSGNAYVAGDTASSDFPTTAGAFQAAKKGGYDGFVTKLNSSGSALVYSTFLGSGTSGFDYDGVAAVAVDASGNAYVVGTAYQSDFPLVQPFQGFGGVYDGFATKLNPQGQPVYSTFLGGSERDQARAAAIDAAGNLYVTGYTESSNFPVKDAIQPFRHGDRDVFLTKLHSSGLPLFSTYLGGGDWDEGYAVTVDTSANVYLAGFTYSRDFPVVDPFQSLFGGDSLNNDAFVAKVDASGARLVYSSYLGGNSLDEAASIAVDGSGSLYVAGRTFATNFPGTAGAFQTAPDPDWGTGFIVKLADPKPATVNATIGKTTYAAGDTITASELRLKNPNASALAVRLRIWFVVPSVGEHTLLDTGAQASFMLPANLDVDFGPIQLIPVGASFPPRGSWQLNARITNPSGTVVYSEDANAFTVQ
jgi:hypothetical protein